MFETNSKGRLGTVDSVGQSGRHQDSAARGSTGPRTERLPVCGFPPVHGEAQIRSCIRVRRCALLQRLAARLQAERVFSQKGPRGPSCPAAEPMLHVPREPQGWQTQWHGRCLAGTNQVASGSPKSGLEKQREHLVDVGGNGKKNKPKKEENK